MMQHKSNHILLKVKVFLLSLLLVSHVQAGMIIDDLELSPTMPDIFSADIGVIYNNDGSFEAFGFAFLWTDTPAQYSINDGTFDISGTITSASNEASGTLMIGGIIDELGFTSGSLLEGELLAVGGLSSSLNFLFNVTGGDAMNSFGGSGSEFGIILSYSGYQGNFLESFSNVELDGEGGGGNGIADTFPTPVPEISSFWLLLLALSTILFVKNKKV